MILPCIVFDRSFDEYYLNQSGGSALEEHEVQDPGDEAEGEVGGEYGEEPGRGVQGGIRLQPDQ